MASQTKKQTQKKKTKYKKQKTKKNRNILKRCDTTIKYQNILNACA
jgi:hypothetical protein